MTSDKTDQGEVTRVHNKRMRKKFTWKVKASNLRRRSLLIKTRVVYLDIFQDPRVSCGILGLIVSVASVPQ